MGIEFFIFCGLFGWGLWYFVLRESSTAPPKEKKQRTESPPRRYYKNFVHDKKYCARTPAGFFVQYRMRWNIERINNAEFDAARMLEADARERLIDDYHQQVFVPFWEREGYFFRFRWFTFQFGEWLRLQLQTRLNRWVQVDGKRVCEFVLPINVFKAAREVEFAKNGCRVELLNFEIGLWDDQLIEENYKMIAADAVRKIQADNNYTEYEDALVVAAMQREVNLSQVFLQEQAHQTHENERVLVKTELVGRNVKITWRFKQREPRMFELKGFRKEDGFGSYYWSDTANGLLVAHSNCDGSVVENLEAGKTYFYNFFVQAKDEAGAEGEGVRFQVRIPTVAEFQNVEREISRLEALRKERPVVEVDPKKERLNQALEELGLHAELEEAIDGVVKKQKEKINSTDCSPAEKEEKLSRLDTVVESIRMRFL